MLVAQYFIRRLPVQKSVFDRLRASHYAVAAKYQPDFRRAFAIASKMSLEGAALKKIEQALLRGSFAEAEKILLSDEAFVGLKDRLIEAYHDVTHASAAQATRQLGERGVTASTAVSKTASSGSNPAALAIAKAKAKKPSKPKAPLDLSFIGQRVDELYEDITSTQRESLRRVLADGVREGLTPAQISKRVKRSVGLLPREVDAVSNRFKLHLDQGLSPARAEKLANKYSAELLVKRADRIAITETTFAEARAKQAAWKQARDDGDLKPNVVRRWVTSDSPCKACLKMRGKTAPLDGTYPGGVAGPGLHPHCFCMEELVAL